MAASINIDDDSISYHIYFLSVFALPHSEAVLQLRDRITQILVALTKQTPFFEYVWNFDKFSLQVSGNELPCLTGVTRVKDNIEDEWFITLLLFRISALFTDTVIQVSDGDGEFLLIEAAQFIPKWLQPNTATNRVFIANGLLHILPLPNTPGEIYFIPGGCILMKQALEVFANKTFSTVADDKVQQAIQHRLNNALKASHEQSHYVNCMLPLKCAQLMQAKPALLPHIVHALAERDPIDLRNISKCDRFPANKLVRVRLRFSRFLFAKLKYDRYNPPLSKKWTNMPLKHETNFPEFDLGVKLTTGLAILSCKSSGYYIEGVKFGENNSSKYAAFIKSLEEKGFFAGTSLTDGSYNTKLECAKHFFADEKCETSNPKLHELVEDLIHNCSISEEEFISRGACLPASDSEEWLNIEPAELDSLLNTATTGTGPEKSNGEVLERIANDMEQFMDNVSTYEGVEFNTINDKGDDNDDMLLGNDDDNYGSDYSTDDEIVDSMQQMDAELESSTLPQSFTYASGDTKLSNEELDVDFNLVTNTLLSYAEQNGLSGPVSNILASIGLTSHTQITSD